MTESRTFLCYSDKLFTPSESFIPRAYSGFSALRPIYIGHDRKGPGPNGAQVVELGTLHGPLGEGGFKQLGAVSSKLRSVLANYRPGLIHAQFGKSGAYALPLAKALNLPLLVTYHGGDATKKSNTKDSAFRVYNRRRAQLWEAAAQIIAVSEFIKGELVSKGAPEDKIAVHYNGVDPHRFEPGDKQNVILFAARWTEKKGIDTLIEALVRLGPKLDGWRVRLLGGGDEETIAPARAAGVDIDLPGWVPADDMPKHLAEATIVCVPSRRAASGDAEGLPMICMEAMLSGAAVMATQHAGIPEAVVDGETGYLVAEGDAQAFAAKLETLISDRMAALAMGQRGRARALERFNLHTQSHGLEALLAEQMLAS